MFENICIILLVNIIFYAKAICYKYSSDDIPVYNNPPNTSSNFQKFVYWLEGRIRYEPQVDHFLSIIIHAIVCVLIYTAFGANEISFWAALLFSFNPVNNQGNIWCSGKPYAYPALGILGAMTFPKLSFIFMLLATYFNAGFIVPLSFIAHDEFKWFLLMVPIVWAIYYKRFRRNVEHKMNMEMFDEDKAIKIEKLILGIKTLGFYTTLCFIPFKNTFYHSFLQSASGIGKTKAYEWKDRFFFIGLMFIGLAGWYVYNNHSGNVFFCIFLFLFAIAPFLNFFRMSQEIAERYCYLPNVAIMYILASMIYPNVILLVFFLAVYATKMWFYMDCYEDEYYLTETACLNSPDSWFAWHVRAMKRFDAMSYQEALILWTICLKISPKEFKINFNIASLLAQTGHKAEAEKFLKTAEDNIPGGQEGQAKELIRKWREGNQAILL